MMLQGPGIARVALERMAKICEDLDGVELAGYTMSYAMFRNLVGEAISKCPWDGEDPVRMELPVEEAPGIVLMLKIWRAFNDGGKGKWGLVLRGALGDLRNRQAWAKMGGRVGAKPVDITTLAGPRLKAKLVEKL